MYRVGDRVYLWHNNKGERVKLLGTVRFKGETEFQEGQWLGLQLDERFKAYAKNNGSVNSIKYFDTNGEKIGLFVRAEALRFSTEDNPNLVELIDELNKRLLDLNSDLNSMVIEKGQLIAKLNEATENLEISEVEKEILLNENGKSSDLLQKLKIDYQALKEVLNNDSNATDKELLIKNKRLELQNIQLNEKLLNYEIDSSETIQDFQSKIESFSESLTDYENCKNKLNDSIKLNENLKEKLKYLQDSESIIERLTDENEELFLNNSELKNSIKDYEQMEQLNKDLEEYHLQIELDLNNEIAKLKLKMKTLVLEINTCNIKLNKANEIILNLPHIESEPKQSPSFPSLYRSLLQSYTKINDEYNYFILATFKTVENGFISNFQTIYSTLTLQTLSEIVFNYLKSQKNIPSVLGKWVKLHYSCSLIIQLIRYDTKQYLSVNYQKLIENIINSIKQCIEENEDERLLLDMDFKIEINTGLDNFFEESLIMRECLYFELTVFKNLNNIVNEKLSVLVIKILNQLETTRKNEMGIIMNHEFKTLKLLTDLKKWEELKDFLTDLKLDTVKLTKNLFWKVNEVEQKLEKVETFISTSNEENIIQELKLKIKILQSKLETEQKLQLEMINLQTLIRNKDTENRELLLKIEKTKEEEGIIKSEIDSLRNILKKYGIDNLEADTSKQLIVNQYMTLEKTKLIDNIHRQRALINKLTNSIFVSNIDSSSYSFLKSPSTYPKPTPSDYFKRIDKLFELNETFKVIDEPSEYYVGYEYQNIVQYINKTI